MSIGPVDFLVVVAVEDERDAVKKHFNPVEREGELVATISRADAPGDAIVVIVDIAGMGPGDAQTEVSRMLSEFRSARVILVGIAAGFPERDVDYGDVLTPFALVPYDLARATTDPKGQPMRQFRTVPIPVSEPLWRTAYSIARNVNWSASMKVARPEDTGRAPAVHCAKTTLVGSGPELVGTEKAEVRRWLLDCMGPETKASVIGLEMEGVGVSRACRAMDAPFLLVKAMQDDATESKSEKEGKWRMYAADASATFAREIIRRFKPMVEDPIVVHLREAAKTAQAFEERLPNPRFARSVRRADSQGLLRGGHFAETGLSPTRLIPDDAHPNIRLHGEGGLGKSTLVQTIFPSMLERGLVPVFLDLKGQPQASSLEHLVKECSRPQTDISTLRVLAGLGPLAIVVDGLNEIGIQARTDLVNFMLRLRRHGETHLLVTDRMSSEDPDQPFQHYELEHLAETAVEKAFDERFGARGWEDLAARLQEPFRRPFFLNLALKLQGQDFADVGFLSDVLGQFCHRHANLSGPQLDEVATSAFSVLKKDGTVRTGTLMAEARDELVTALVSAGVLDEDGGFSHDLWRDYFVARRLALDQSLWNGAMFDLVTNASASFESLRFTIEMIVSPTDKDAFVTAVFDWNWVGALDCLAGDDEGLAKGPTMSVRLAVLAAAAERKFDALERTSKRAMEHLALHRYPAADPLREPKTRGEIVREVVNLDSSDSWFDEWRQLFIVESIESLPVDSAESVRNQNSLVGWAAANAIYRARADDLLVAELERVYEEAPAVEARSVRWRVVHAMGRAKGDRGADALIRILKRETDDWVLYGTVRSLLIQAGLDRSSWDRIVEALRNFVSRYAPENKYMRTRVLEELVEAAFTSLEPEWRTLAAALVRDAASRVDVSTRKAVEQRAEEFAAMVGVDLRRRTSYAVTKAVAGAYQRLQRVLGFG